MLFWLEIKRHLFVVLFKSYGGFYSATVLATAEDTFTTAVAVAPVTDWRYYGMWLCFTSNE